MRILVIIFCGIITVHGNSVITLSPALRQDIQALDFANPEAGGKSNMFKQQFSELKEDVLAGDGIKLKKLSLKERGHRAKVSPVCRECEHCK